MKNIEGAYIQTFSNKRFHILAPTQDEICIEDIAHALALQCRFTGHVRHHYSVAQHVVLASYLVPPKYAFEALHHDDSEAYICDMSRPLKHFTDAGVAYLAVEGPIQDACNVKFGIYPLWVEGENQKGEMSPEVKRVDNLMLYAEKNQLMKPMVWDTRRTAGCGAGTEPEAADVDLHWWPCWYSEFRYTLRHYQLSQAWGESIKSTVKWAYRRLFGDL